MVRSPFDNRLLYILYAILFAAAGRTRNFRLIFTDGSNFAMIGFFSKILFNYFWVMDVWDRPRWRPGQHENGMKTRLSDRVIFWMMGRADFFLLSVLPPAAKDIDPSPERSAQFFNCINLSDCAETPPARGNDPVLHIAYGKARFDHTLGVSTVVAAAEQLHARGIPVKIHIVGRLTPELEAEVRSSAAAGLFEVHGFIDEARGAFYRRIHAGICPYEDYEDLRYIFPIKVLEHLSQGNPLIVSRLPALCAMIEDDYNGLVVEPGNPRQLADAIERLAVDRVLWQRLADNALKSVRRFDVVAKNRAMFEAVAARYAQWRS
ncbi:MAG: glycosyltransferase family 4 protein [Rhodospirillales bacterium]|nr:glycosyltransferase family 4 protein [Rhodospirillales bacterium]